MTTIELEARKAIVIREILTQIDSEEAINKLQQFVHQLRGTTNHTLSISLLNDLTTRAEQEDAAGLCISSDELEKEMQTW